MIKIGIEITAFIMALAALGCSSRDQMNMFIKQVDSAPPSKRPPNWEQTKRLMQRIAPAVGQAAPDFSLMALDGRQSITMSKHRGDRPLVLIFGSFT
jgi:hypothetical protein